MRNALYTVVAIVAAATVVLVLLIAVEAFSAVVHPFPEDFGGTTEEICLHVERYPHWVLAVVVPAWAAAAFAGVWLAQRIGNLVSATIIGLLLVASLVLNISMLPYPLWFKMATLVTVPAAVILGTRLGHPKRPLFVDSTAGS